MADFTVTKAVHGGFVVMQSTREIGMYNAFLFAGDAEAVLAYIANDLRTATFAVQPSASQSGEGMA